ncbi:uncharacterized protein [Palaemon carinicauda]|uniref:uncharacterized protein n=1 Tax=Palaemon carinicauda TaxID=392227 RepID=UPI0035B650A6
MIRENKHWMGDGTFKIAPQLFYQLYVIHIQYKGNVLPMVYMLLQRKSEELYRRALLQIQCLDNEIAPVSISCDYEKAFHNAFLSVFNNAEVLGCFFHLSQAVWRKIQDLGLNDLYCGSEEVRKYTKMLVALAFVPPNEIVNVFELLQDVVPDELHDLVLYFEDTWIGRPCRRGRRRNAMFPPSVWSVYERVLSELPRTNNSLEGWHRAIQMSVGHMHPTIYKCVNILKLEQNHTANKVIRIDSGQDIGKNTKYVRVNKAISRIVSEYSSTEPIEYLRSISYNISLQK